MKLGFGKEKVAASETGLLMFISLAGGMKLEGRSPGQAVFSIWKMVNTPEDRATLDRAMVIAFFETVRLASLDNPGGAGPLAAGLMVCAEDVTRDKRWECAAQILWTYYLARLGRAREALMNALKVQPLLEAIDVPADWALVFARALAITYGELSERELAAKKWQLACEIKEASGAEVFSLLDLYFGLGNACAEAELWEEARTAFLKIWLLASTMAPLSEEAARSAYEIAFASLQLGDPKSGIEFLGRSIAIREQSTPYHRELPEMRDTLAKLRAKHGA